MRLTCYARVCSLTVTVCLLDSLYLVMLLLEHVWAYSILVLL